MEIFGQERVLRCSFASIYRLNSSSRDARQRECIVGAASIEVVRLNLGAVGSREEGICRAYYQLRHEYRERGTPDCHFGQFREGGLSGRPFRLLLGLSAAAAADKPVEPINTGSKGLAVKGYDPVAYFTEGEPVEGSDEFELDWSGAIWRFSSAVNRDLFRADPEQYAPQYGGYCAYAVSKGHTAGISPQAWTVKDGKLYLNHRFAKGKFRKDVEGAIKSADENWPKIPKKPAAK